MFCHHRLIPPVRRRAARAPIVMIGGAAVLTLSKPAAQSSELRHFRE